MNNALRTVAAPVLLLAACATNPAARRATLIADADRAAKEALAAESKLDPASIPARSFAVVPFAVSAGDTAVAPLGFGLAEMLSTDLAVTPELRMVDRLRIDAVLRELDLVDSGIIDPPTAPRIGRIMGARRLLTGSVETAPGGAAIRLNARVIDVISGTVQELVSAEAPMARAVDAERSLALLLFERLGVTLTPAQRLAVEQRPATQLAAVVAFGRGVQAEAHGDAAAAASAFAEASRLDASFVASQSRTMASGSSGSSSSPSRASALQRVVDLSAQAINQPAAAHVSEAADAPLPASLTIGVVLTIRVIP